MACDRGRGCTRKRGGQASHYSAWATPMRELASSQWLRTASNAGSRLIMPTMALRIVDMHNSATRLLPKPKLPNAAKTTRMIIRSQKRMITSGRFGSCAKI
jgi:hypothetical protein